MSRLTIFKASAGSGKTFQLALYYLTNILSIPIEGSTHRRLISPDISAARHREILAITFTNKATEEMKVRIINALREVSNLKKQSSYRTALLSVIDTDASHLALASARTLSAILYDFGNMHISTIDSFFQSVLRSFAYEADLSGNYELMLDGRQLQEMAIADTLASAANMKTGTNGKALNRQQLRTWLYDFLQQRITDCKDITLFDSQSSLRRDFAFFMRNLSGDAYQKHARQLNDFFSNNRAIENLQAALASKLQAITAETSAIANELLLSISDFKNVASFIKCASEGRYKDYSSSNISYINGEFENSKILKKGTSEADADRLRSLFDKMLANCKLQLTIDAMLKQIYSLGLFKEVDSMERELKLQQNTILLSDTTSLLHGIIDDCPTPFIYERTGQRLHHFLIDEFQDTSLMQWQNLSPLVTESLSSGYDNLIIGDVKQCIYRFRNAEPSLLDRGIELELSDYVSSPTLDKNFRSSPTVVEFNCGLFDKLSQNMGFKGSYSSIHQSAMKTDLPGYVHVETVNSDEEALDRMIQQMQRQLDPAGGGYSPGDIVVLTRTNSQARIIVEKLVSESRNGGALPGVSVLSDEALYVNNSRAVRFMIDKLREINRLKRIKEDLPEDSRALKRQSTTELDIEWMSRTLTELNSQGIAGEDALTQMLGIFDNESRHAPFSNEDETLRNLGQGRSLFQIVESLVNMLPDSAWIQEEAIYISAFQDLILDFCRTSSPGINNFLNLWDSTLKSTAAIGLAAGVDAIRVMTIHKSKGLEFPCVHLPFLNDKMDDEKGLKWYDATAAFKALNLPCVTPDIFPVDSVKALDGTFFRDEYQQNRREGMLDSLNVMYVAFTRAVNELSINMRIDSNKSLPVNIITPVLAEMSQCHLPDKEPWECNFGTPTHKDCIQTIQQQEAAKTLHIDTYDTPHRLQNMWSFTEPTTEPELDL